MLMQADSAGYINFHASRTVGYPTFLWSIHKLFGSYAWLPAIQLSIHFMAALFLSITVYQLTRTFLFSLLLLLFVVFNVEWVKFDFMILTESISGSLLLMVIAFMMRVYLYSKTKDIILLAMAVGLSILVRPVSYALVPVLGCMVYLVWPQFKARLWMLILPLILALAMGAAVQRYRNGFWDTESFLGHNLLGKAAIIVDASIPSRHPDAIQELSAMATPIQAMLKQVPTWKMQYIIAKPYYDYLRYTYGCKSEKSILKASDQYWKEISWDVIKARPLLYVKDVMINYFALWFLWDLQTTAESQIFRNLTTNLVPFPYYGEFPAAPRTAEAAKKWGAITSLLRGALILSFIMSFFIIGYVFYLRLRKNPINVLLCVAFTAALIVNGYYGLTALLQAGLPRYALFAWPAIGVMMVNIVLFFWKKYKNDYT